MTAAPQTALSPCRGGLFGRGIPHRAGQHIQQQAPSDRSCHVSFRAIDIESLAWICDVGVFATCMQCM